MSPRVGSEWRARPMTIDLELVLMAGRFGITWPTYGGPPLSCDVHMQVPPED